MHEHAPPASSEVLVVGAGPTGLALATMLARRGVAVTLLDRLQRGENTSRAAVIHAHTMEALDDLGIGAALAARGHRIARFAIRDRDRALVRLSFDRLPSPHPYLVMLAQNETEAVLADALHAAGGAVHRGWAVESVAERGDRCEVVAARGAERRTFHATYVVGADGMHSLVRRTAGIGFTGATYDAAFVLADVAMSWDQGRDEVKLFFSPNGLLVVAPLPGGIFRIVATVDDAPAQPTAAHVQALLDTRGPARGVARIERVLWGSRFRLHHRIADAYRKGRLLLVGDAAHVHSPAGGQGMNTGLVDAFVLGRILADVLSGRRDASFLDTYETLRRPAAAEVMRLVDTLTRLARIEERLARLARNALLATVTSLPRVRERLQLALSGISRRRYAQLPSPRTDERVSIGEQAPLGVHG